MCFLCFSIKVIQLQNFAVRHRIQVRNVSGHALSGTMVQMMYETRTCMQTGSASLTGSSLSIVSGLSIDPVNNAAVNLQCPIIIKYRDEKTDTSLVLEDALR